MQAAAARCFNGKPCKPGSGANLQNCDFTGSNALKNVNCTGCNGGGISLIGADACSGANFRGANLGNACLIDADLTNARFNSGTNLRGALFCRAIMPDGSVNNSGCDRDTIFVRDVHCHWRCVRRRHRWLLLRRGDVPERHLHLCGPTSHTIATASVSSAANDGDTRQHTQMLRRRLPEMLCGKRLSGARMPHCQLHGTMDL